MVSHRQILFMQHGRTMFSRQVLGISMMIAPLLFGLSTFFWKNGGYGIIGGTILIFSLAFWIPVFIGLFALLKGKMPVYASVGFIIAVIGCISGVNFGMVDIFLEAFGISHEKYLSTAAKHPLPFNLLLFWTGPLFPLSLLVLSINLMRKNCIPIWTGILIFLGAIAFPVSRIPRIEMIAHMADLLLAIPIWWTGWQYLREDFRENDILQKQTEKNIVRQS